MGKKLVKSDPKIGTIFMFPITLLNPQLVTFIMFRKLKHKGAETLAKFLEKVN